MHDRDTRRWVPTAATAALAAAAYAGYRRRASRWGATGGELARALPGDDVVSDPQYTATNAIEIRAEPEHVWPWLVQMGGYPRAGWYSYARLDTAGRPSADRIVPELQQLRVGDVLPTAPDGTGFRVERIEPRRCLVLAIRSPTVVASTALVLDRVAPGRTRLVDRTRFRVRPTPPTLFWAVLVDAGHPVMVRRMLRGIRERAERLARGRPGASEPEDRAPGTPLRYDLAVVVRRPPPEVYAVLADVERFAGEPDGPPVVLMERLTEGPTREGTAWREVVRLGPGLRMTVCSHATAVEPDRMLTLHFRSPWFTGTLTYTIEPAPAGSLLRQQETLRLRAPLRPLGRVVDRSLRPRLLSRLATIRDLLESGRAGALPPARPGRAAPTTPR
ncbi:MAG TPA: SRPBCC family protein [Pseudonocardia sp.]|nr:SRPBCC family protein [Pseudonocardia sp.]